MFDLVITGGTVHDGTGGPPRRADVGVREGRITAVEADLTGAEAAETIDATDRLVTPGFVDVHTHFDGQATWDEVLDPATGHGVTTVIMGNCGVGFAPVRPGREAQLIELMEGVEDIPGAALTEGMSWGWESFPQYLDVLEPRRWTADVGTQVPHGALRSYIMAPGSDLNAPVTAAEADAMARLAAEAIEAGAFGFTTSRTVGHRAIDGSPVPGTFAAADELLTIADAVGRAGGRIMETAVSGLHRNDDGDTAEHELEWMARVADQTGLTTTFICLQVNDEPTRFRRQLERAAALRASGRRVVPLVAGRPFGVLFGWDVRHPFMARASYRLIAGLPLAERMEELRRPDVRAAILGEPDEIREAWEGPMVGFMRRALPGLFVMHDRPDYEQPLSETLAARAERAGVSVDEVAYDGLCHDGAMLLMPLYNYVDGDHQALYEQLQDPDSILGLNDAGAHCGSICDASLPTYLLTHWVRDRARGPRIELADAIRRLTSQTADLYGLRDRGRIQVGLRADLNVIDLPGLRLEMPVAVKDLPAGGTRLLQQALGYDATIAHGQVVRRHGVDTGARPGRLLRRT